MVLLQGVLDGYLKAGTRWGRDDVAGMLLDRWLPSGTQFSEGGIIWMVFYERLGRGYLVSEEGDVLWAVSNGHVTLAPTEQVARWMFSSKSLTI